MSTAFSNVTIKSEEVVAERSRKLRGPLFRVHLRLSDKPPAEWTQLFAIVWGQRVFYDLKRRTGIEGDLLWIECVPDELGRYHLDPLRSTVTWTNQLYKKGLERQKKSGKTKAEWFWLDHVRMDDLAGGLNRGS